MLHAKVNAVALLRFVNEEIFQRIVAVGRGKRFFAELAVNRTCRMLRLRPHANDFISRCALRTKEIDGFGHERLPQSWSPRHMSARRQCQRWFKHTADLTIPSSLCHLRPNAGALSSHHHGELCARHLTHGELNLSRHCSGAFSWLICKQRWMPQRH